MISQDFQNFLRCHVGAIAMDDDCRPTMRDLVSPIVHLLQFWFKLF